MSEKITFADHVSESEGIGLDEGFYTYSPPNCSCYIALILRKSGEGMFKFIESEWSPSPIPAFALIPVIIALCIIVNGSHKKLRQI